LAPVQIELAEEFPRDGDFVGLLVHDGAANFRNLDILNTPGIHQS
jgi:hypothetical protein